MQTRKPVGIWVRVSTEDQAQGESPEHHEMRARHYAEAKGWGVKEVYDLSGVSGKSVMEHSEAKRMLKDIKSGYITGLIFSKLARLARNTRELLDFADIFREYNADLISLHESIDTSSPAGRLFYTMIAAMAQWEREEISERVAASVPIRAKLGKFLGGQAPFGYRLEGKELVLDEKESPIRKLIHELFLEHKKKKAVAKLLNEKGYRTRNGSRFSDTTVDRLLRDPIAKGQRRANYSKSLGTGKKWVMKPQSEWVTQSVPAIVPEEIWDKCFHLIESTTKKDNRTAPKTVHLFSGLVFCECGSKMYVLSNMPKYVCNKCRNKIGKEDLEEIFYAKLNEFMLSDKEISSYFQKTNNNIKEKESLLNDISGKSQALKVEMKKILNLHMSGNLSAEGFKLHYNPLEVQLKQIEDEIPNLLAEIDFLKIESISSDEILNDAKDLSSKWSQMLQSEKRTLVESITEKITISESGISIDLYHLPQSPKSLQNSNATMFLRLL